VVYVVVLVYRLRHSQSGFLPKEGARGIMNIVSQLKLSITCSEVSGVKKPTVSSQQSDGAFVIGMISCNRRRFRG